jgi:H+/gluconate symporter-like permease
MTTLICLASLAFLMFVAYRGFSVILFAPIAALLAVLLTDPANILPVYSGLFMHKMVIFVENYFPIFLLGAVFGKVIEVSGFAQSIVASVVQIVGRKKAILSICIVGALLTYGGVSLFVVVFALYPFAAAMFKACDIPKRLIPSVIILGGATFTMDCLPGTPAIQNIIPTTFFHTTAYAAPVLGLIGAVLVFGGGMLYLEWRCARLQAAGEGYGTGHINEPEQVPAAGMINPWLAISPLFVVGILNLIFTKLLPTWYPATVEIHMNSLTPPFSVAIAGVLGVWSVEVALAIAILYVCAIAFATLKDKFTDSCRAAIGGALLATMNTASEYGYGSVIAALPGFLVIRDTLTAIPNPLLNEAITINVLAGVTGSASGGLGIALAAMADQFVASANANGIPLEVLHRVASMASGGMDSLPHNGAVITFLAICGLTHKQSYPDIFGLVCVKTAVAFLIVGIYYATGLV